MTGKKSITFRQIIVAIKRYVELWRQAGKKSVTFRGIVDAIRISVELWRQAGASSIKPPFEDPR